MKGGKRVNNCLKIHKHYAGWVGIEYLTTMTAIISQRQSQSTWEEFCRWVTSTNNRLYVGWFGIPDPYMLAATICFITAFIAAPPVDIDKLENQLPAPLCMATTSFQAPSCSAAMPSDYTSTQFGKLLLLMNGYITEVRSSRCIPLPHWYLFLHGTRMGT